jgi:hypothetical protein
LRGEFLPLGISVWTYVLWPSSRPYEVAGEIYLTSYFCKSPDVTVLTGKTLDSVVMTMRAEK